MPSLQGFSQAEKNGFSTPGVRWLSSCRASLWAGLDKHPRELPSWRLFTAGSEGRRLDGHRRGGGGESRAPLIYQPVSEWLTLASKRGCWSHSQYLPNRTVTGAITSLWPFVMREARLEKASLSPPGWQAHPCSPLGVPSSAISTFHRQAGVLRMMPEFLQNSLMRCQWSIFIPIPKKDNAKEYSNYRTIAVISHVSKVILKNPSS